MEVLNSQSFQKKVFNYTAGQDWKYEGDLPAIVDFYADWCGPCRMLSPVLEEISKEYAGKIHVYKVDTEASPELAALFGIRSIPSILFVPNKGEPAMAAGFVAKDGLKRAIKEILQVAG